MLLTQIKMQINNSEPSWSMGLNLKKYCQSWLEKAFSCADDKTNNSRKQAVFKIAKKYTAFVLTPSCHLKKHDDSLCHFHFVTKYDDKMFNAPSSIDVVQSSAHLLYMKTYNDSWRVPNYDNFGGSMLKCKILERMYGDGLSKMIIDPVKCTLHSCDLYDRDRSSQKYSGQITLRSNWFGDTCLEIPKNIVTQEWIDHLEPTRMQGATQNVRPLTFEKVRLGMLGKLIFPESEMRYGLNFSQEKKLALDRTILEQQQLVKIFDRQTSIITGL